MDPDDEDSFYDKSKSAESRTLKSAYTVLLYFQYYLLETLLFLVVFASVTIT